MTSEEIIKLVLQFTGSEKLKEGATAADLLKDGLKGVQEQETKTESATDKLKEALGKAKEGFAQFAEGGIEKALPAFGELLGLIPGVGPGLKILGLGLEYALPHLKTVGEYVETAGKKFKELTKVLADAKAAVADLADDETRLNEALETETLDLENATQAQKDYWAAKEPPVGGAGREKDRAETFRRLSAGSQEEMVAELTPALSAATDEQTQQAKDELHKRLAAIDKLQALTPALFPAQAKLQNEMFRLAKLAANKEYQRAIRPDFLAGKKKAEALISGAAGGTEAGIAALAAAAPEGGITEDIAGLVGPDEQEAQRRAGLDALEQLKANAERERIKKARADRKAKDYDAKIQQAKKIDRDAIAQKKKDDDAEAREMMAAAAPLETPEQAALKQHMAESRQLTGQAFAAQGYRPNPQQLESASKDALRRFEELGDGILAAQLAAQASINQLNQAIATVGGQVRQNTMNVQHGERLRLPSQAAIGW